MGADVSEKYKMTQKDVAFVGFDGKLINNVFPFLLSEYNLFRRIISRMD